MFLVCNSPGEKILQWQMKESKNLGNQKTQFWTDKPSSA